MRNVVIALVGLSVGCGGDSFWAPFEGDFAGGAYYSGEFQENARLKGVVPDLADDYYVEDPASSELVEFDGPAMVNIHSDWQWSSVSVVSEHEVDPGMILLDGEFDFAELVREPGTHVLNMEETYVYAALCSNDGAYDESAEEVEFEVTHDPDGFANVNINVSTDSRHQTGSMQVDFDGHLLE